MDWDGYEQWILSNLRLRNGRDTIRYSKKYCAVLQYPSQVSRILKLKKHKRRLVMASLFNLSRYLGVYEHWKQIMQNHGLKWERIGSLDAVINLLNTNLDDVED